MRQRALLAALAAASLPACIVAPQATPLVDISADVLSQYNHRGMPQNDEGVLQGELAVNLPGRGQADAWDFRVWGNMDLQDDTGDAWFPDGHGTEVTEVDVVGSYSRPVGGFDVTVGVFHYGLANGSEFAGLPSLGGRGPTTEVFANVSREVVGGVLPRLTLHYDFDEVEDAYVEAGAQKVFRLNEKMDLSVDLNLAWSSEDASLWTYGLAQSGLADLRAEVELSYFLDDRTTLRGLLGASTILDSDIQDWFELVGIESDNVWLGIGVTWSF
jgi:hypothetical protein